MDKLKNLYTFKQTYFWLSGFIIFLYGWNFFTHSQPYLDTVLLIISGLFLYFYPPENTIERYLYFLFLSFWVLIWSCGTGINFFYSARRTFAVEDLTLIAETNWREALEFFRDPVSVSGCLLIITVTALLYPAVQRGIPYGILLLNQR